MGSYEKTVLGLLDFLGISLEDVKKMRRDVEVNNKMPRVLLIPKCELMGMELKFADVANVQIEIKMDAVEKYRQRHGY